MQTLTTLTFLHTSTLGSDEMTSTQKRKYANGAILLQEKSTYLIGRQCYTYATLAFASFEHSHLKGFLAMQLINTAKGHEEESLSIYKRQFGFRLLLSLTLQAHSNIASQ